MENFSQSSLALQRVAADVASSGRAIEHLKEQKAGASRRGHLLNAGLAITCSAGLCTPLSTKETPEVSAHLGI